MSSLGWPISLSNGTDRRSAASFFSPSAIRSIRSLNKSVFLTVLLRRRVVGAKADY